MLVNAGAAEGPLYVAGCWGLIAACSTGDGTPWAAG